MPDDRIFFGTCSGIGTTCLKKKRTPDLVCCCGFAGCSGGATPPEDYPQRPPEAGKSRFYPFLYLFFFFFTLEVGILNQFFSQVCCFVVVHPTLHCRGVCVSVRACRCTSIAEKLRQSCECNFFSLSCYRRAKPVFFNPIFFPCRCDVHRLCFSPSSFVFTSFSVC